MNINKIKGGLQRCVDYQTIIRFEDEVIFNFKFVKKILGHIEHLEGQAKREVKLQQEIKALNQGMQRLSDENNDLKKKLSLTQSLVKRLQGELSLREQDIKGWQAELSMLRDTESERLDICVKDLEQAESEVVRLKKLVIGVLDGKAIRVKELKEELALSPEKEAMARSLAEEIEGRNNYLQTVIAEKEKDISTLKKDNDRLENRVFELKGNLEKAGKCSRPVWGDGTTLRKTFVKCQVCLDDLSVTQTGQVFGAGLKQKRKADTSQEIEPGDIVAVDSDNPGLVLGIVLASCNNGVEVSYTKANSKGCIVAHGATLNISQVTLLAKGKK